MTWTNGAEPWLLLIGSVTIILFWFLVYVLLRRRSSRSSRIGRDSPARRVVLALAVSMGFCLLVSVALRGSGGSGLQIFAESGLERRLGLPVSYLAFVIALAYPWKSTRHGARLPGWWFGLAALLGASLALGLFVPRQETNVGALVESTALTAGLLIAAAAGLRATSWTLQEERALLVVTLTFGIVIGVLGLRPGPYAAAVVPSAAVLIYLALTNRKRRFLYGVLGVGLTIIFMSSLLTAPAPSSAGIAQVGACAGILVLSLIPRTFRITGAVVAALGTFVLLLNTDLPALMMGQLGLTDDVTLEHRAYEAAQVFRLVTADPVSLIFGLGPSATVNLTQSPDADTLLSSGRTLTAVDDVHFLTSWVLLKFGLLGLVWLVVVLIAFVVEGRHVMSRKRPDVFSVAMLMFAAAGIAAALPAATFFFSSPLPALALGILRGTRLHHEVAGHEGNGTSAYDVSDGDPVPGKELEDGR
jgi:hypothetical protein